jgi:arylsulfatase
MTVAFSHKTFARNESATRTIQQKVKGFFADYDKFRHQEGNSLNAAGINHGWLRQTEAPQRVKDLETMSSR